MLVNRYGERYNKYFPDKQRLDMDLQEFCKLRAAVAHNKMYSLEVLGRLRKLRDSFEDAIGGAAQKSLESMELSRECLDFKWSAKPIQDAECVNDFETPS